MRRAVVLLAVVALADPATAWSSDITLAADRSFARYDEVVRFEGTVASHDPQEVLLVRNGVVVGSTVASGGSYAFELRTREPGTFVARTGVFESAPIALQLMPKLNSRIVGRRKVGYRVLVVGRLRPARAGQLLLRQTPVRVTADGRFRILMPTSKGARFRGRLRLRPRAGYLPVSQALQLRLALPALRIGSHGPAVRALKQRLSELHYALPNVNAGFGRRTHDAVLAFQKVHGLARTGRVGPALWRTLWQATIPTPRVRRGDYLEVDKTRQLLMEVRGGNVVRVIHVSTGATGNTPVGTWRVYRQVLGWDWVLYHPLYFLRGFAIHGYSSVPPWPASHGCVRVPMWLANGLRERWGPGSVIRVYA
jgi:N-acetylmuramoyl-L-alanine amidase